MARLRRGALYIWRCPIARCIPKGSWYTGVVSGEIWLIFLVVWDMYVFKLFYCFSCAWKSKRGKKKKRHACLRIAFPQVDSKQNNLGSPELGLPKFQGRSQIWKIYTLSWCSLDSRGYLGIELTRVKSLSLWQSTQATTVCFRKA